LNILDLSKITFFKKKGLKKAPNFFQNQNRTIILSFKKAVVYILSTKKMILENGAKWNLWKKGRKKDYKYNILKKLIH